MELFRERGVWCIMKDENPASTVVTGNKKDGNLSKGRDEVLSTESLFGDRNEILLSHANSLYRLKITKHGKLILNK